MKLPRVDRFFGTAILFGVGVLCSTAFAQNYTIMHLGVMPGKVKVYGTDVNNNGHVVGWCGNQSNLDTIGFFWSPKTGFLSYTNLGDDVDYLYMQALNESDTVVGYQWLNANTANPDYVGLVAQNKTLSAVLDWQEAAPGDKHMTCSDINEDGIICGTTRWHDGEFIATKLTNGQHQTLGRYSTDKKSSSKKINNLGHVLGRSWGDPGDPDRNVYWNGAQWTLLNTLGGSINFLNDLNDSDLVVGTSSYLGNMIFKACYWVNASGDPVEIGTLGGQLSEARGVNNKGEIVGVSNISGDMAYHPFIYREGVLIDLFDLLPDDQASQWSAVIPVSISDTGYITGSGTFNGVQDQPFLMIPDPLPGTVVLYTFDEGPEGWVPVTDIPPFEPGVSSTPASALALSPANAFPVFCFWQSPEIEVEKDKTYQASFTITSTVLNADDVPQFRLRAFQPSNNLAWFTAADSVGNQPPPAGETKVYTVVFAPDMPGDTDTVRLYLDLTHFNPLDDGAGTIILRDVTVWEIED